MILYISDRSVNSPVMEGKDGRRCFPHTYIHTLQTLQTHVKNPTQTRESYQFPPPLSPPNNSTGPIYLICTYVSHSHSTPHTTRHKHTYGQQRRALPISFESQNSIPFPFPQSLILPQSFPIPDREADQLEQAHGLEEEDRF